MNPSRYFMPNIAMNPIMMRNGFATTRGIGVFNRISQGIRSFNWSKMLNGASRTLNVMNQTIPLVKQVKPMVGNVKNMLHLAKAFRNETSINTNSKKYFVNSINQEKVASNKVKSSGLNSTDTNLPIFFI